MALAISPVPPLLPQKELMAGAHGAYAISLVAISAVLSIVYVPVITSLFADWFRHPAEVSSAAVAQIVLTTILAPLALGIAIHAWLPSLAERTAKPVGLIGVTLLLLCCVPLLIQLWPLITSFFGDGTLLMLALIVLVGTAVGHLLGGPDSWDRYRMCDRNDCHEGPGSFGCSAAKTEEEEVMYGTANSKDREICSLRFCGLPQDSRGCGRIPDCRL